MDIIRHQLHTPVLVNEIIKYLQLKEGMVIVDCTMGTGGHAEEILKRIGDSGRVIGIDCDEDALIEAKPRLTRISDRFNLFCTSYTNVGAVLKRAKIAKIQGALFDLGLSSFQIEKAERGFSIKSDGPLDMRMDRSAKIKASDIVNTFSKKELAAIFRQYGDEYFAFRIAEEIVGERRKQRIESTARLAEIVKEALPYRYRFRRVHPATKVFMALRIAVNDELENIEKGLTEIVPFLDEGSRICVITFHSIEDRIVKNKFKEFAKSGRLKIITKKPIRPNVEEIRNNPRARSAKLRVAEKIIGVRI